MKPVAQTHLEASQQSRVGKYLERNSEFCGWTAFTIGQDNDTMPVLLAIVADGISNDTLGEEASQLAVQVVRRHFTRADSTNIPRLLVESLTQANQILYQRNQTYKETGVRLGATLTVAVIVGERLYVANVGDSRLYLLRPGRPLQQLTTDHSRPESGWGGHQSDGPVHPEDPTLARYLGQSARVEVDLSLSLDDGRSTRQLPGWQGLRLSGGDILLLATDGLTDAVPDSRIQEILGRHAGEQAVRRLLRTAGRHNPTENASAIVLEVPGGVVATRPVTNHTRLRYGAIGLAASLLVALLVLGTPRLVSLFAETAAVLPTNPAEPAPTGEPAEHPDMLLLPTMVPSATPTATNTPMPTATPSPLPSATPMATATEPPTPTPSPTPWPTNTRSWVPPVIIYPATATPEDTAEPALSATLEPTSAPPVSHPTTAPTNTPAAPPERPVPTATPQPPSERGSAPILHDLFA